MTFSQAIADDAGEAALYLRWRLPSVLPQELRNRLQNHLSNLRDDGLQAGVELSLGVSGNQCLLTLKGLSEPMPAMLQQALLELSEPGAAFWQIPQLLPRRCCRSANCFRNCPSAAWTYPPARSRIHWMNKTGKRCGRAPTGMAWPSAWPMPKARSARH